MGLLTGEKAETLKFQDSKKHQRLLKANAAKQLARILSKFEDYEKNATERLLYGTELECHLLEIMHVETDELYSVYLDSKPLMKQINETYPEVEVKEEFSAWMIEFVPKKPFTSYLSLAEIRTHFRDIDRIARNYKPNLVLLAGMSVLPHIGSANYYIGDTKEKKTLVDRASLNPYSGSDYFLDSTITSHSRFRTLTENTHLRHEKKPEISLPIFKDLKTVKSIMSLDHFGFGMCNTALQITYSCKNLKEARFAHDMMHVLSPFMLVFSSSTFAANQMLIDYDNRYHIIEEATDDRKPDELGVLEKTRYSPINFFLSENPKNKIYFNDKKATLNKRFLKLLKMALKSEKSKLANDKQLLIHFAYLFVRDYLIVFPERVKKDNMEDTLDFEVIQSTNWHNMRLKPPGSFDSGLGWLLEFRCMDSPLTEIEKSLLTFMTSLFFRVVTDEKMDINFYMPISKVDLNFKRSFKRNSIVNQKFFFRKHFCRQILGYVESEELVEITMLEFWSGSDQFAGMFKLIKVFLNLNSEKIAKDSYVQGEDIKGSVLKAFAFFEARASGKLATMPSFFRSFVTGHADYKNDSVISDLITTDILKKAVEIQEQNYEKSMFGDFKF